MAEHKPGEHYLILDGGMGTMLQQAGIGGGGRGPELFSILNPSAITAIHAAYLDAGADIVYTNTFGANRLKTGDSGFTVDQIVTAAVKA
ncbi:MAG TPA: homocysteine S-methyltransferase family protein, partial [Candidatus Pygmaiobacter gallistercoris]|nr:homocysteine S-methyltransferase family protein [Candidatus Pygmaiobacter gallistercoris]